MKDVRKYNFLWVIIVGLLMGSLPLYAQVRGGSWAKNYQYRVGIGSLGFLKINPSARSAGMADCFTATADDISAIYWNPAGLTQLERPQYNVSYTSWLADCKLYAGALAFSSGRHAFGISLLNFAPAETQETTIFQPDGTGRNIEMGDVALGLSYAVQFTDKLSVGFRGQWIQETLYTYKITTVALDIGTLYYTGFGSSRVAMSIKNFGGYDIVEKDMRRMYKPLMFNLAIAGEVYGAKGKPISVTLAGESSMVIDFGQRYHLGAEVWLQNMLALRAGYKFGYGEENPWGLWEFKGERLTFGIGGKLPVGDRQITFDLSYTQHDALLNNPVRFSLGGSF